MWLRIPFAWLVLAFLALAVAASCGGSRPGEWKFGDSLAIRSPEKATVTEVAYTGEDGKHYVLRPSQDGNRLLLVRLIVTNSRAAQVSMRVGPDSVTFLGKGLSEFASVDPLPGGRAQEVEETPSEENRYAPFIWGSFDLVQGYQVDGWMVFEVPPTETAGRLRWDTGDTVYLDL
ncbi:MAG: hypothetical protein HYY00_07960 [Chloroflexi bacterium]|nr:hypothetical protein [Chloroflexota bacterium]